MEIKDILIEEKEFLFLEKRKLTKQFKKAKRYILSWNLQSSNLKLKQPKSEWIYYFRINKQFRALAFFENWFLKVFKIDNHQN